MIVDTETIDKLFLELSQVTKAETYKELIWRKAVERALRFLDDDAAVNGERNGSLIQARAILRKTYTDLTKQC